MTHTTLKKRIVEGDKRGKLKNHRKLEPYLIGGVKNHINSISIVESHYLRNCHQAPRMVCGGVGVGTAKATSGVASLGVRQLRRDGPCSREWEEG